MKKMKLLILTTTLVLCSFLGFSQTTPTGQFRVQTRTTVFDQNLPAGTQIYVVSDSTLWQSTAAIASTLNVETAQAFLTLINSTTSYMVQSFEATGTSPSATYTLSFAPRIATVGVTVMMNGAALRPTTDYTTTGVTLTIISAQSQYDKFVVSYTYYR